ncbi:hypothetical protein [Dyadobacter psychrotolerans]|uniref:Uncharacterized protein n=1 Tax=Dyadobacter psychrotolerans TaxID=2541721 RepID=A0A4R5DDX0_9BACT|nr:hypothetical protein [Dyadobacter psychrotolerans]TDE10051.1 hypothetical protein E0F88_29440 [Dyadobacter psychrotolerans]
MSATGLKSEVIRLVNGMDDNLMEDLLSSIKLFIEQQESPEIDNISPDLVITLNESLRGIDRDKLLSNEEIKKATKTWLTK